MSTQLINTINGFDFSSIDSDRKEVLQPLIAYIQSKKDQCQQINLNFICTHNSRRSHLSQIWAQVAAWHYSVNSVTTYSGGTEATAMYHMVGEVLSDQGLDIQAIASGNNPVYAIKYDVNKHPIIAFSKKYDDAFNPESDFAAILTCNSADKGCPIIIGAEKRIPVTYVDPKAFDDTDVQKAKYLERSQQIGTEMCYVFDQIK